MNKLKNKKQTKKKTLSVLPCPPPGDLPNPGIKPMPFMSPALAGDSLPLAPLRKPTVCGYDS